MILNKRSYRWFYDHIHSHYYDLMIKWCALPFGGEKNLRKRLLEPVSFGYTDYILDMCCGTGSATFTIAEKAGDQARIVGLDLSIGQLRIARAKNRFSTVRFLQGDAASMNFPEDSFDKVFITHAIHEMKRDERMATLKEARRILKDGGTVVVLELDNPNSLFVRVLVGFWFFYWLPFNFETPTRRDMFRRGVISELRKAGFAEVHKTSFFHGVFQVVQATKEASRTLLVTQAEEAASAKPKHIRVTEVDGHAIVTFENVEQSVSFCSAESSGQLGKELQALVDQEKWVSIILDFGNEAFIPQGWFELVLVHLHKILGEKLKLCNLPSAVMEHFEINRLATVFDIYPKLEDALVASRSGDQSR
jgi:demethylmenaquinone methyltransferase/2-methoxy-6-polyprenyl-1,4-benzoquinol methylase